jgi:hypothetical protein
VLSSNKSEILQKTDTIVPVANISSVTSINNNKNFSSNSFAPGNEEKILLKGEAFDVGSGIQSVKIRVNKEPFESVNQTTPGEWLNWNATILIKSNEYSSLVIKSEDKVGNIEYLTILTKPEFFLK